MEADGGQSWFSTWYYMCILSTARSRLSSTKCDSTNKQNKPNSGYYLLWFTWLWAQCYYTTLQGEHQDRFSILFGSGSTDYFYWYFYTSPQYSGALQICLCCIESGSNSGHKAKPLRQFPKKTSVLCVVSLCPYRSALLGKAALSPSHLLCYPPFIFYCKSSSCSFAVLFPC